MSCLAIFFIFQIDVTHVRKCVTLATPLKLFCCNFGQIILIGMPIKHQTCMSKNKPYYWNVQGQQIPSEKIMHNPFIYIYSPSKQRPGMLICIFNPGHPHTMNALPPLAECYITLIRYFKSFLKTAWTFIEKECQWFSVTACDFFFNQKAILQF